MITTTTLLNGATTTATGATIIFPGEGTFQATGKVSAATGAAVVYIEVSNDGEAWLSSPIGSVSLTLGTTLTSDGFAVSAKWQYVRARVYSISGTNATVTVTMGI